MLERDELVSIRWELWEVSVLLLAFVIAQFAYYACLPYLLKMASATALNLSLLATDYYTVVAGMAFFNYKVRKTTHTVVYNIIQLWPFVCIQLPFYYVK